MADTQSNIQVNIDTTQALASIKNLQRQISAFHSSMAKGGAAANAVSAQFQQTLINSINSTGKFAAEIRTIKTTTESFTSSLERNKFSLGEYFRFAGGASKTFGRLFKTEQDTINKVARENVKDLQTQYVRMGRDASGAMKAIAVRPLSLDMTDLGTRTQIAAQKQAIFNQLLKQGSTNLLNFGKNTQWAGRQLMVGFTLPLIAVGSAAAKTFMDMETQAIRFKKVYGDLFTPNEESQQALSDIKELGKEFTKYGIAVSTTVGLAAEAAAAGFKGVDLTRQTTAATRLSILGQVESQKALETTISLQNAFSMSSENLAESIDFLNAVENQTVLSLDDISTAIPKAAPIIQQLGGDVKDLAFLMTAMKEGGINASEGANALKSGLASMINPTGKANAMLESFGINVKKIVVDNKGDLKKTVVEFATALNQLDPLNRAQAIEQMFGKFQFARLSTLFANVTKEGTQASRVLDLAGSSVQQLAALSEKELGMTSESAMNKFKSSVENLKLALIPLGEEFLKAITPIAKFITKILEKFDGFSSNTKKIIVTLTAVVAGLGPVLLMTAGLVMNGLANMIKLFAFLKSAFNKTGQSTAVLGSEVKYMTTEQRNAAAVAASLDQVHTKLAQTFTSEASAVNALTRAYQRAIAAQSQFVPVGPPITRGPIKKFAGGRPSTVGGTGNKDSELALLMPGETVIPTAMSAKYGSLINAMIADKVPGYEIGKPETGSTQIPIYPENAIRLQPAAENMAGRASTTTVPQVLSPLALRIGEARGIAPTLSKVESGAFDQIYRDYQKIAADFVKRVNLEYNTTFKDIKDENERMRKSWAAAGKAVKKQVDSIASPTDRAVVRKAFAIDEDDYATIPTDSREAGGTAPNRSRRGAFKSRLTGLRSYTRIRPGAKRLYERMTKKSAADLQMGHVFPPRTVDLATLEADPRKSGSVATARAVTERGRQDAVAYEAGKKKGKIKDPYVTSTESTRKSPHPQAAKDGRDDARAYSAARDKELRKQSGRARRAATRPQGPANAPVVPVAPKTARKPGPATRAQGPAPIGATPQPGMTILPIVPPGGPTDPPEAKPKGIQRLGKMGGGMGLLGANMALSMAPDFAGKGMMQGTLAGANLGMMFGGYGIAAGAAIGLITTAINALIQKQKQHRAMTEAMFKSSTDLATFFGNAIINTEMSVGNLASSLGVVGTQTKKLGESFGYTNSELKAFIDLVASLPENNPLKDLVTGLTNENDPKEVERIAKGFVTTQIAIGQIKPEQAQKSLDLLLASTGKSDMVGTVFMTIKTQVEAVSLTLRAAKDNTLALGQTLTDLSGAASNATSLEQMKIIIDGIAASGISAASALSSMYYAYLGMGNIGAADTIQVLKQINGITAAQSELIFQATQRGFNFTANFKTNPRELAKQAEEFLRNKKLFETENTGSETLPYQSEQTNTLNKQIDLLKKKKKIIDDQIKKEKEITDELKKQNDYLDKQRSLDKEIVDAKIRGEYIEAASLLQEKTQLTSEFNKDKEISILEKQSDALQARIDALQESSDKIVSAVNATTSAVVASGQQITDAIIKNDPPGGGTFVGPDGSSKAKAFPVSMTPEDIKSYIEKYDPKGEFVPGAGGMGGTSKLQPSDLDPANAWKNAASKDALEEYVRRILAKQISQLALPEDGIVISLEGSDKKIYKFKVQKNGEFIRMGQPVQKASGGMIRGAGTGTSDSIPALLSNGEYVVKAKSVKKYGVGALDALNAGRFAEGGLIQGYAGGGLGEIVGGVGKFIAKLFGGKKIVKPKPETKIIPKLNMAAIPPEERAFHFASTDLAAMKAMLTSDVSSLSAMSVPSTGVSFNPVSAAAGLAYIKSGLGRIPGASSKDRTPSIWELVQSQRETLLRTKYPNADLSDVKTFNQLYAKEFYGLEKDDMVTLFKGTRTTKPQGPNGARSDWRVYEGSLETYFSTNPYIAAEYAARIRDSRTLGSELPMFSMDVPVSQLKSRLGEGAVKPGYAQGSFEFPQLVTGQMLAAQTPKPYYLPTQVYGQMFPPKFGDSVTHVEGWPFNFANGGKVLGRGTPTSDSIPAMLSNGEYVVKADSVKKYGVGALHAINAGKFAEGGQIGRSASSYIPRLNDGGMIPGYGGGGLVGNILGGIGKLISKLFVGKQAGKPIKPNKIEKFLSDTLGDVPLPKIKKEELPAGVGGQYIPRFSDKSSNYENLLPHILFNSKYKVQGNTAIHETMHHFDMDVLHDSFRKTIAKLRKDGKKDLADEYESLFVTAENKQKGMGLAAWEDRAITLQDYDSITYFGGAAEAFADESTFKAYSKFISSPKIKDKKLALQIGNPYGPSYGGLKGYFSSYAQFENNALNMPMRLNPSFLRGLVENSPNMPQATKDVYLGWAEGLQRFKPPARTNPDEIRNSLQWQNFKKYITDNGLDKAKGFHDGGPVGHKHPSTSYNPSPMSDSAKLAMLNRTKLIRSGAMSDSLPKIPYYEQYDPLTGKAFRFPTDDEYVYDSDQLIPPSMRSKKPWYEPFKRMANPAPWGIGTDLRGKEVTSGIVDFPYNAGKFAYDNLIFPTALWADRMTGLAPTFNDSESGLFNSSGYFASTNRKQEAEWIKKSKEEGLGSVLPGMAGQKALDFAAILPWNRIFGAIGNAGIPKATVARIAAEKASEKAATKLALEEAGIGLPGMLQSIKSKLNPNFALRQKIAKSRKRFEALKAEGKILTPEGNQARIDLAQYEALLAAKLNNFTPIMNLRSATPEKLIAEHKALPSLIEEPFELNGKPFIFKFHKAVLNDGDTRNMEYFIKDINTSKGLGQSDVATGYNLVELIDPSTGMQAAYIRYDPITGHIRRRETDPLYRMQHLSAALYNKAAQITRIRHSSSLTQAGRGSSPLIGGFMADDPIYNLPALPGLKTTIQKFIQRPKKPKKPKKQELTTSDSSPLDYQGDALRAASVLTDRQWADYLARNNPPVSSPTPNSSVFANETPDAIARRQALEAATRARAEANFDNNQDSLLAAWRGNLYRTYNTYPFNPYNGAYDVADEYDLQMLMKLTDYRNAPAQVPWRSNSQRPERVIFPGKGTSIATGGYLDKGKLRIPKFANGGLIKGPGTGISDSIQAGFGYAGGGSIRVSNGEYVVKASSVRDYGVDAMNAVNNGTATIDTNAGGTVYNINMPVTSNNANPEIVANEVMKKLKLEVSKNNKTNKVNL